MCPHRVRWVPGRILHLIFAVHSMGLAQTQSFPGGGRTTSFASLRMFCAIAASMNSN
jgi:hypothetical protein